MILYVIYNIIRLYDYLMFSLKAFGCYGIDFFVDVSETNSKCLMTFKTVLVKLRRVQLLLGTAISMTYMKLMRYSHLIV